MNQPRKNLPAILGGEPVRSQGPPDWPIYDANVANAVQDAVKNGTWGQYHGPHVGELTRLFAEYQQREFAILTCSGTAAVELALRGLKVGPGDEVILAAYDFKGNFQDVLIVGAKPVLVDVHPENGNLDPAQLAGAITDATAAILVSHLHGGIVPMPEVMRIAADRGIPVIEDACQMPGARISGRWAGNWGDVGVFSFGGSKLLTAGRGGALVTDRPEIAQRIKLYTQRGNEAYPLSELQAAALIPQLEKLDTANAVRARNAADLCRALEQFEGLAPFWNPPFQNGESDSQPGYYKFGIYYDAEKFDGLSRDDFSKAIRAEGIALDPGFRALHLTHSTRRFRGIGSLKNATAADERILTLHHPVLSGTSEDIDEVIRAIRKVAKHTTALREHFARD